MFQALWHGGVNQVEVASSWWISVAMKGMDVVCSNADVDCEEGHVHIKIFLNGHFLNFFQTTETAAVLMPGLVWRCEGTPWNRRRPEQNTENNRGCYIETRLCLNGAKMIFGWNKCGKKEYSAHHQTSGSSKHQAEPSTQGWTDSCLNVVYAKFWPNHLNAATAVVTH